MQNVCDDGCIKHGSEFSCVCDERHTVHLDELFTIDEFIADGLPSAVRVCCDMLCLQNIYALCTEEQHIYILVT